MNTAFIPCNHQMGRSRSFAILHVAIHDALNANDRRFASYMPRLADARGASVDAAAAAAHDLFVAKVPRAIGAGGTHILRAAMTGLLGCRVRTAIVHVCGIHLEHAVNDGRRLDVEIGRAAALALPQFAKRHLVVVYGRNEQHPHASAACDRASRRKSIKVVCDTNSPLRVNMC
jgi:hypothetical protein